MLATADPSLDAILTQTNLEARTYQGRIINKGYGFFANDGVHSTLINSPVGSGKTPMGLLIAKMIQQRFGIGVGWVAMRQTLLAQAAATNVENGINVEGLTMCSMFDKNPPTHDENGTRIEMVVCDEAHHSAASSMIHVIDRINPKFHLGLSGTPFRTDKIKLCFQKTIQDAGIRALVDMGYLSQYHKYVIPEWTPKCVVERYLAEPERWGKSAFYWRKREDAMECWQLLLAGGARAGIILGDQSDEERELTLRLLEVGELDCVVNLFVLTEGWDMPSLKTAFVRDSSRGPTIQMGGRVFRIHADHPYKQIVQSAKTRYPMDHLVSPAQSFVWTEGMWRSIKANDSVEKVSNASMMVLAHANAQMPDFITRMKAKNGGNRRGRRGGADLGGGRRNAHGMLINRGPRH